MKIREAIEQDCKELGLERIESFVKSENLNCKRALEKLHSKYEDCKFKNGNLISIHTCYKLKED